MGLMDKMKVQAEQLAKQAQQGVAQGQSKISEMQANRAADSLLQDLGAAVYAAQRQGASNEPIEGILAALDAHAAKYGPIDTAAATPAATANVPVAADGSPAPAAPTPPPATDAPSAPAGDFTADGA